MLEVVKYQVLMDWNYHHLQMQQQVSPISWGRRIEIKLLLKVLGNFRLVSWCHLTELHIQTLGSFFSIVGELQVIICSVLKCFSKQTRWALKWLLSTSCGSICKGHVHLYTSILQFFKHQREDLLLCGVSILPTPAKDPMVTDQKQIQWYGMITQRKAD